MAHKIKINNYSPKRPVMALLFLLLSAITINSQVAVQWTKTFGSTGDDGGYSMLLTGDGGIVIAGFKSTAPYSYKDVVLMKTDASGNELWSRMYNFGLNDIARSVRQTSDGGFIIAGMTETSPQVFDPFLIKTDAAGIMQWQRQYDYGFGADDRAHDVQQTSDGGYIIAGQTWLMHGSFGNYDMYIIKTDVNGNVLWRKVFFRENDGADVALSVHQLTDRGYIIGGFTQSSSWAAYVIRTDSLGNSVWSNIYPGSWQSECYDIQPVPDGGFILTGTESSFETDTDVLIIKLNAGGSLLWKKIYGTVDADQGNSLLQLQDGGFIIAGMSAHSGTYDEYVLRTNSTGDSLWSLTIVGTGDDRAFSVKSPQAGSFLIAGWTWSSGLGMGDIYLAKLTESITGNTKGGSVPKYTNLSQNYPNPFNPSTKIRFSLPSSSNVKLAVYDMNGREVEILVNRDMQAGVFEAEWRPDNLSSGIYFYTLKTNSFTETKKMIFIK